MEYHVRCLSRAVVVVAMAGAAALAATLPGMAAAQTAIAPPAGGVILLADLPPILIAAKSDYGLNGLAPRPAQTALQASAMLQRLFASGRGVDAPDHYRAAVVTLGGIAVTAEAMRGRLLAASGFDRKARTIERAWVAGLHADWAVGADDSLSIGAAADRDRRAEPAILPGRTHIKGNALATEVDWSHGSHVQMALGWRADRSASPSSGAERLVELAQGAALREQGFRLTLSYLVAGRDASRGAVFGIAARDARVAAADLASIGTANREDVQAALFLKAFF